MSHRHVTVPEKNGVSLITPPLGEWGRVVADNRVRLHGATVCETPLATLMAEAREEVISAATEYTRDLGLPAGENIGADKIIASGHQPVLFHPGIEIKIGAMLEFARSNGTTPLFITVDSDEFEGENVRLPQVVDGKIKKVEHPIFPQSSRALFESAKTEPRDGFIERLRALAATMDDERLRAPHQAFVEFINRMEKHPAPEDFTARLITMRRVWEGDAEGYLEIPVSRISRGRVFRIFAEDIIKNLERFTAIYNNALDKYRKEHKLRYPANPFPNLMTFETPFWVVHNGWRDRLFAKGGTVFAEEIGEHPLSAIGAPLEIRPRAITLSLFMRLFVGDFFIHGVGGAKYDEITDAILQDYYGIESLKYGCVTCTLSPMIPVDDPTEALESARRELREMEQHPDKFAELHGIDLGELSREKIELLERINIKGADRKTIGLRIKELNHKMSEALTPARMDTERGIVEVTERHEEWNAATARDYPCLLQNPERVYDLLA